MKNWFLSTTTALLFSWGCTAQSDAKFTSQSNAEFAKTISGKGIQLIDVRTPEEYKQGHLPEAVNMNIRGESFDTQIESLNNKYPVAVYCRSGASSKTPGKRGFPGL